MMLASMRSAARCSAECRGSPRAAGCVWGIISQLLMPNRGRAGFVKESMEARLS